MATYLAVCPLENILDENVFAFVLAGNPVISNAQGSAITLFSFYIMVTVSFRLCLHFFVWNTYIVVYK